MLDERYKPLRRNSKCWARDADGSHDFASMVVDGGRNFIQSDLEIFPADGIALFFYLHQLLVVVLGVYGRKPRDTMTCCSLGHAWANRTLPAAVQCSGERRPTHSICLTICGLGICAILTASSRSLTTSVTVSRVVSASVSISGRATWVTSRR